MRKYLKYLFNVSFYFFPPHRKTRGTAAPINFFGWLKFKLGLTSIYWPVHHSSTISGAKYIKIGIGTAPGLSLGCYITASEKSPLIIGDYTIVAPNVVIVTSSHSIYDYTQRIEKYGVKLGAYCWVGANSSIMPGVVLGDHVVVGAGSVVTHSFEDGYCVIAGNPAKVIKKIEPNLCLKIKNKYEYYGYIPKKKQIAKEVF